MLGAPLHPTGTCFRSAMSSGRSSGVEHNLAKVGVEGSNPFARSSVPTPESAFIARRSRPDRGDFGRRQLVHVIKRAIGRSDCLGYVDFRVIAVADEGPGARTQRNPVLP